MALATYTDLQTSAASWLHRGDLTTPIIDFIALFESKVNRGLRVRQMQATTTLSVTAATVAVPSDFLEARNLTLQGGTNPPLDYVTPEQLSVYDRALYTGQIRLYTQVGGNFQFAPPPDQTYSVTLEYYQKVPALASNSTNWLLTSFPDAYLYGTLLEASLFVSPDPDRVAQWKGAYDIVMEDVNRADDNANYSGSVIRVRPDVSA